MLSSLYSLRLVAARWTDLDALRAKGVPPGTAAICAFGCKPELTESVIRQRNDASPAEGRSQPTKGLPK